MTEIVEIINQGIGYARIGMEAVRTFLTKITTWMPWDSQLTMMILFLAASIIVAHFIVKKFVTRPFQIPYCIWLAIIAISLFLNLMFL